MDTGRDQGLLNSKKADRTTLGYQRSKTELYVIASHFWTGFPVDAGLKIQWICRMKLNRTPLTFISLVIVAPKIHMHVRVYWIC